MRWRKGQVNVSGTFRNVEGGTGTRTTGDNDLMVETPSRTSARRLPPGCPLAVEFGNGSDSTGMTDLPQASPAGHYVLG
jgi:hypothetical protein